MIAPDKAISDADGAPVESPPWHWKAVTMIRRNGPSILGYMTLGVTILLWLIGYFAPFQAVPSLACTLLAEVPVFDVSEPASGLSVIYKGQELADPGSMRVLAIRFENDGTAPITPDDYVEEAPLGIVLTGERVLEVRGINEASNDYLARNVAPSIAEISGESYVMFAPVLLNPGDWFVVSLTVAKTAGSTSPVSIRAKGAIAGVRQINLVRAERAAPAFTYLEQVMAGSLAIQGGRFAFYGALGIAVLVGGIYLRITYSPFEIRARREEKQIASAIEQYKASHNSISSSMEKVIEIARWFPSVSHLREKTDALANKEVFDRAQRRDDFIIATFTGRTNGDMMKHAQRLKQRLNDEDREGLEVYHTIEHFLGESFTYEELLTFRDELRDVEQFLERRNKGA